MMRYVFPYKADRTRTGKFIYRPAALVRVMAANSFWHLFRPYVDSGADLTLLKKSDCEDMGYDLTTGTLRLIGGISKTLLRTYVHQIPVRIGETQFLCRVAFAEIDTVPRLLGRLDVFHQFRICFEETKRETHFWLL